MELSVTAYVVLGAVRMGAETGYRLKMATDLHTRFCWRMEPAEINRELQRLVRLGLVEREQGDEPGARPAEYTVTAAGEHELREWLRRGGGFHHELRHEGVTRLFFADALPAAERLDMLRAIRTEHELERAELRRVHSGAERRVAETGDAFPMLMLETGIEYQELFIELCDRLERRLGNLPRVT